MRKHVPVTTVHWGTVGVFGLMAVLQLVPMLMGHPGRGYTPASFIVVGMLVGLWTAAALGLEPPRFCAECGRRMVVQVRPDGWWAACSRHGQVDSKDLELYR